VQRGAEYQVVCVPYDPVHVVEVHVVRRPVTDPLAVGALMIVVRVRELRERTDSVGDLAGEEDAGGIEYRRPVLGGDDVAAGVVVQPCSRQVKRCHDSDRDGTFTERITVQLEHSAVGSQFRKLSTRMAGDTALSRLTGEYRERRSRRGVEEANRRDCNDPVASQQLTDCRGLSHALLSPCQFRG
jgi:hypothetical protein